MLLCEQTIKPTPVEDLAFRGRVVKIIATLEENKIETLAIPCDDKLYALLVNLTRGTEWNITYEDCGPSVVAVKTGSVY